MFRMSTTGPSALLVITCNRVACFSRGCSWDSNRGSFSSMPQVLQCSWFPGAHSVLWITPQVKVWWCEVRRSRWTLHTPLCPVSLPLCRMWWTLVLRTPDSRGHCHTDFLNTLWRPVTLPQHFIISWTAMSSESSLSTVGTIHQPQPNHTQRNCYTCWWRCSKFISSSFHLSHVLLSQQHLRIHIHFSSVTLFDLITRIKSGEMYRVWKRVLWNQYLLTAWHYDIYIEINWRVNTVRHLRERGTLSHLTWRLIFV
jgi:hypothetical protein